RQPVGPEPDPGDAGDQVGPARPRVALPGGDGLHAVHAAAPNSSEQLLPPNPKELFITLRGLPSALSKRTCAPQAGSRALLFRVPGSSPCSSASSANTDSTMPAAPRVCPVQPLVELACSARGNTAATARASTASLAGVAVPCRLR